ncbi:hypothetical protein [Streptomyces xanthophaeus]
MRVLDVVGGRIVYGEIFGRTPVRPASPGPAGTAEVEHPQS